jgi:hypothetical protein
LGKQVEVSEMINKIPSEYITEFLNFIAEAQSHYKFCYDEVNNHDRLTQNFLHSFELDGLKCNERSKLATKLETHLKDRRYYKDRVEELESIVQFFEEPQNKKVLDKLRSQVLGQVRKAEAYHKDRVYIPREIKERKVEEYA